MNRMVKLVLPAGILLASILGAILLAVSKPDVKTTPAPAPRPLVRVMEVEKQDLTLKIKSQGNVTPRTQIALVSQVAGRVVAVAPAFAAGGFFEKGDILVKIDRRDYVLAVTRAEAQVAQAEYRMALEQQEAKIAGEEWKRLGKGDPPTDLVLRKPQLAEARAGLAAAKAALDLAHLNLERTEIRAPFAGRVRTKNVDVGQFVAPGTPVANIFAVDWAEVRLPLPQDDLAFLDMPFDFRGQASNRRGPEVILRARFAGKLHEWRGFIQRLEGEIDARTRMIVAVARIENPYARNGRPNTSPLVMGMFVEAEIRGKTVTGAVEIPRAAVRNENQVLVVDGETRLRFRTVEILRMGTDRAVVSGGLENGERVCLSPLDAVVDGMPVRILGNETAARTPGRELSE